MEDKRSEKRRRHQQGKDKRKAQPDGKITRFQGKYSFLSNFYACVITLEGVDYSTVEHAFQAAKTHDLEERYQVQIADSPGKAKRLDIG